jgi:chaperonin GroES
MSEQNQPKHIVLPTFESVLVQRMAAVTETAGGIVVPEQSVDRPSEGTIVALGPHVMTAARRAAVITEYLRNSTAGKPEESYSYYDQTFDLGDHVLFGRFAGKEITVDDVTYVKLKTDEIDAIVRVSVPVEAHVNVAPTNMEGGR